MKQTQDQHNDPNYEQKVQSIKDKLKSVIQYGQIERPQIMEKRSKALRTYGALLTKCKSTHRPIPPITPGLEPEVLTTRLEEVDKNATDKITILKQQLRDAEDALVTAFDNMTKLITDPIQQINTEADGAQGTIEQQQETLDHCSDQIKPLLEEQKKLVEPFQELTNFRLQHKTLQTLDTIQDEIDQIQNHLNLLNERLKHERLVREFNEATKKIIDELNDLIKTADDAKGTIEEREVVLNASNDRVKVLPDAHQALEELYKKLIEYNVKHKTSLPYDGLGEQVTQGQNHIDQLLERLNHERLLRKFNDECQRITKIVDEIIIEADKASGTIEDQEQVLDSCNEKMKTPTQNYKDLSELYQQLVNFKIHSRTIMTLNGLGEEIDQAQKHIDQLLEQLRHELLVRTFNEHCQRITGELTQIIHDADHAQGTIEEQMEIVNDYQEKVT
jgi:DNA repair exonuclease SbcCD ATPase subunit